MLLRGPAIQPDSYNYLVCIMNFDYPVGYPYLLRMVQALWPGLVIVTVVQALVFALGAAFMLLLVCRRNKSAYALAGLLAIDPISGYFCSAIMSEALFIPLLLVWVGLIYQLTRWPSFSLMIAIGVVAGILYLTRFGFILLLPFPIIFFATKGKLRPNVVWLGLIMIASFQLTILPVRVKYKQVFDTYSFNHFSGLNLWNNASVLWLTSEYRNNPQNDFEQFLVKQGFNTFTDKMAYTGQQISNHNLPHMQYVKHTERGFMDKPLTNAELGETGWRLIREQPWGYISKFAVGNYAKPLLMSDSNIIPRSGAFYEERFGVTLHPVSYSHYTWWACLLLLAGATLWRFTKYRSSLGGFLCAFCWYYILVLPLFAPMWLRYYFVLMPFILVASLYPLLKNLKKSQKAYQT